MDKIILFINSPVGPKTTHFWGPFFNAGFVVQGFLERNRPPEKLSRNMQMILTCYSGLFMRFALRVRPINYFLFCVHFCNFGLQGSNLHRRLTWEWEQDA